MSQQERRGTCGGTHRHLHPRARSPSTP